MPLGYTIAMWAQVEITNSYLHHSPHSGGDNVFMIAGTGGIKFYYYGGTNCVTDTGGSSTVDGEWHLFIGWWDAATGVVSVQMDNETVITDTDCTTTVIAGSLTSFRIGTSSTNTATGSIDNVAIWNRPLTAAERVLLRNAGAGTFYAAVMDFMHNNPFLPWSQTPQIRRAHAH